MKMLQEIMQKTPLDDESTVLRYALRHLYFEMEIRPSSKEDYAEVIWRAYEPIVKELKDKLGLTKSKKREKG